MFLIYIIFYIIFVDIYRLLATLRILKKGEKKNPSLQLDYKSRYGETSRIFRIFL